MQHECPSCGHEFRLAEHTLPGCPECIRKKMKYPGGLSPKHKPATAPKNASYVADGVDPEAIYRYLAGGSHPQQSGCVIFYSTKHESLNAVSHKPLNQIPGSGNFGGSPGDSQFAVWVDLEGKSKHGPHLTFEEENHLHLRIDSGEWVKGPKCASCGIVYVWKSGSICLNCVSTDESET